MHNLLFNPTATLLDNYISPYHNLLCTLHSILIIIYTHTFLLTPSKFTNLLIVSMCVHAHKLTWALTPTCWNLLPHLIINNRKVNEKHNLCMFRDLTLNDSFRVINVSAKRTTFGFIPGTDKQNLFAFFCWWTQFILAKQHFILLTKALVYFLLDCVRGLAVL